MKRITTIVLAAMVALLMPLAAFAIGIGQAKQQGLVGETDSGYIAAVSSPSAEVSRLVNTVNTQRKKVYENAAKKNGIPLNKVEKLAAKKAIEKTPAGQKIRVGGAWKTK